jgi:hypothetical protein
MYWHRSLALRGIAFGTWGNWLSFLGRAVPPAPPERTQRFCERCGGDTPHDSYDDTGYGWYAQMWRCRHCGGESVKVWPFGY